MALPLPNTTEVQICRLTKALYNAAPGATYLGAFEDYTTANGIDAFANFLAGTVSSNAATLAATVVASLNITGDLGTTATAYLTAQLEAKPNEHGEVILDILNALSTMTSDATWGAVATAYNDSIATSYAYSINTANTSTNLDDLQDADEPAPVGAGQSFTLTATADVLTGSAGNDTFAGTAGTIDSDVLAGGAGTDSLTLTLSNADDNNSAFRATSIESMSMRTTGAVTLDLGDVTGVTTLTASRLAGTLTLNDVQEIADVVIDRQTSAAILDINYAADVVSGDADVVNVTVQNSSDSEIDLDDIETVNLTSLDAPTAGNVIDVSGTGMEILNIIATAAATVAADDALAVNVSGAADVDLVVTAATEVTFTGAGALDATLGAGVDTTVSAAAATGTLSVTANGAAALTITGSAQADTIDMLATLTNDDVIDGGDGEDTLKLTAAANVFATSVADGDVAVTGVENLELVSDGNGDAIDFDVFSAPESFTTVTVTGTADADDVALNDVQAATYTIRNASTANIADDLDFVTIDLKDSSGTADAITVNLQNRQLGTTNNQEAFTLTTLTAAGVEAMTINATKVSSEGTAEDITVTNLTTAALETLTLTGNADLTLGALSTTVETVNAADFTGALNLTLAGGDVSVTGGSGDDTLAFGTSLGSLDTIVGGEGDDTVTATLTAGTITPTLTGVETLTIVGSGGSLNASGLTGVTTLNSSNASALVVTNLKAEVADINQTGGSSSVQYRYAAGAAATVTLGNDAAGGDITNTSTTITNIQNLTFAVDNGVAGNSDFTLGSLSADSALKTLTITTGDDADDDASTGNLVASGLNTLTVSAGTGGAVTVGTLTAAAALNTVSLTSTGGLVTVGAIGAVTAAAALTSISVNATGGDIDLGAVGGGLAVLTSYGVTASGAYDTTSTGTLAAKSVDAVTVTATGTTGTSVTTGAMTLQGSVGDITVTSANDVVIGAIAAGNTGTNTGTVGNVAISLSGAFGTSTVGKISTVDATSASMGSVTVTTTGGTGTSLTLGTAGAALSTADGNIGDITITSADQIVFGTVIAENAAAAAATVGNIGVTLTGTGHGGNSSLGAVTATGDSIGNVTINNSSNAAFTAANFATAALGNISITTDGTNGGGNVTITTLSDVATSVGDITITADSDVTFSTGADDATTIGAITVDVTTGNTVNIGATGDTGAVIGDITVTGAGTFTMSTGAVTLVGNIDASDATGAVNITLSDTTAIGVSYDGSAGVDTFVGTGAGDVITAGAGADVITGGGGADAIDLTETTSAADDVQFAALTDGSAAGVAAGTFSGHDIITGFLAGTDDLNFSTATFLAGTNDTNNAITAGTGGVIGTTVNVAFDLATDNTDEINVFTAADDASLTDVDYVVAALNALVGGGSFASDTGDTAFIVFAGTSSSAVYYFTEDDGTDAAFNAEDLQLIGVVDAVLTTADVGMY